jgi:hypothetical protein
LQKFNNIEYQAAVRDGSEGASVYASSARYALVVVDYCLVLFVNADGFHFTALHAGTFLGNDGTVRACLGAFAAFDALGFVYDAAVVDDCDGATRADVLAGVHQASTTGRGYHHACRGALVASCFHHLHGVGVRLVATHSHMDTLLNNGTLLIDTTVELRLGTRTDDLGYVEVGVVETALVGAADDFLKDFVLNPLYVGIEKFLFHI